VADRNDYGVAEMPFTRTGLERAGFEGWVAFEDIRSARHCPSVGGVYVVVRSPVADPLFHDVSCGGHFKGQDPSVSHDALTANWVDGAECVYIGKSNNLHRRLKEYAAFGTGKPIGHWGGRLIWQLVDYADLRVAWKETPGEQPEVVEQALIGEFRSLYGKPPFANEPHRLGA
jgi:hypothetical protein